MRVVGLFSGICESRSSVDRPLRDRPLRAFRLGISVGPSGRERRPAARVLAEL
jgi:hypothetical protein